MTEIDGKKWGVFAFEEIFHICKGFYNKKPNASGKGRIPFLGATDSNNGVTSFLTYQEIDSNSKTGDLNNAPIEKKLFPGHAIAVTNNGSVGHAYYQATAFTCSHDINPLYLRDHEMNQDEAYFLIKVIEEQGKLFQYARKWRPIRMVKSKILLPVDDSGKPDYDYMAQYASEMRKQSLTRYKNYIAEQISRLEYKEIPELGEKEWGAFRVGDIFTVSRPRARNKDDYEIGDMPFVASGAMNNGVMKFCKMKERETPDTGNCITVSPVDGSTFYQPVDFLGRGGAGSSILILRMDEINLFRGAFLARMIQQTCAKYTYGHMGSKDSILRECILLPVNDKGEPDFAYMEQYAKNMILRKYRQYLAFLDRQEKTEAIGR